MVAVSYHCPYCGAVTSVDREGYLNDKCVSREPLDGWTYADTTGDFEAADGIEFVCLGDGGCGNGAQVKTDEPPTDPEAGGAEDPNPEKDGCGRTFYLSFLQYDDGEPVDHRTPDIDRPRFDFRP
jgi:hypothetical protein